MTDDARGNGVGSKEWNANAYHVVSEPQFAWGLRVIERITFTGDENILDAGCGSGRLTKELGARVPRGRLVGCDLSLNMAQAAAQTLRGSPRASVLCANLTALPFRGAFDLIFSTATFHWVRDHDRLFSELRGALRDGGRMEAQCGGGPNLAAIHARADALASEERFRSYFATWKEPWTFASPADTETALRRAGFAMSHCWLEHAPTRFPDKAGFAAFLETVVLRPYLARLPQTELRGDFLNAIVDAAASDEPPFTLDYWRLNITAATI
jgi:trans-aconitate 2-methyltransferase